MSEKTKTAGEVYKKNIGSVVYVSTQSGRGSGSGVVVGDNEVVTNCHVIDDGSPVMVTKPNADFTDSQRVPAKVAAGSRLDMCLLKTKGLSAPAVALGETESVKIGDPVYAISNPGGVFGTLSGGLVSQFHPSSATEGERAGGLIQTDTALSGGSSGGGLFDRSGRLVGIITGSLGRGESLHKSLPVELVKHLRQRAGVEAPLHDELTAALNDPSAEKFRALAGRIVESLSHPGAMARAWRDIGVQEAERGDMKRAATVVKSIIALAESLPASEHRDRVMVDAIHVLANMGGKGNMEHLKAAQKLTGQLGDGKCQAKATAHIVREVARHSIKYARELCENFPLEKMADGADSDIMGELASTGAAMEDSEAALRIADKMIREGRDFVSSVEALARIAYELQKQDVIIGSTAIFGFARNWAVNPEVPAKIPERLIVLAIIGYHAANCGSCAESENALRMMVDYREQHGTGGEGYAESLVRKGLVSEARALCGDAMGALRGILVIPVLGPEIISALALSAIKMSQMPR